MTPGLALSLVAPPTPCTLLTLAAAKAHLKILHTREDDEITAQIGVAEAHCETITGMALRRVTWEGALAAFPASGAISLPWPPLVAVESITYRDPSGIEQTLDLAKVALVKRRLDARIVLKSGQSWPATEDHPEAVVIRWTAGLDAADPADAAQLVPAQHAVKLLVAHWYFNREAMADEKGRVNTPAHSVEALLQSYMVKGWI